MVEKPLTFTQVNNPGGTITLTPAEGTIVEPGTPINAANMNNLETQYDQVMVDINSLTNPLTRVTPTLFNNWVDNSPGVYPSYFAKDATGAVFYYFCLKNGATLANAVPVIMPSGYRPQTSMVFDGYADGGSPFIYHILNGGEVKFLRDFSLPLGNFIILKGSYKAGS
jgi:hypothetical protein